MVLFALDICSWRAFIGVELLSDLQELRLGSWSFRASTGFVVVALSDYVVCGLFLFAFY